MTKKKIFFFNIVMVFFLFLSSQFVLLLLNGKIVQSIGLFIDSAFSYSQIQDAPPTQTAPLPNYPLLLFILTIIVDISYFVVIKFKGKPSLVKSEGQ